LSKRLEGVHKLKEFFGVFKNRTSAYFCVWGDKFAWALRLQVKEDD
jgi:hypothetical protein